MKKLSKIYVEITNVCNLACSFCPPHSRTPAFMSRDFFASIIKKIEGKADVLYFHVKGEPLLHPELAEFLKIAGHAGFSVHLTTNGTLLTKRLDALLSESALGRLNVSLHSLAQYSANERETHTRLILEAAETLSVHNRIINPRFLVSFRLWTRDKSEETRETMNSIERFYSLENGTVERALSAKNSMLIHPGVAIHTAETFVWPSLTAPAPVNLDNGKHRGYCRGYCLGLRDQAGILSDGTVIPCCLDGDGIVNLGNIDVQDWDEIMNSQRAMALYDGFSRREAIERLCQGCTYKARFTPKK